MTEPEPECGDHWHCDPSLAAHTCDKPDRARSCPTCGALPPIKIDRCPTCLEPTHASESDDTGRCAKCRECDEPGHSLGGGCSRCVIGYFDSPSSEDE